jgi:hypothetical protein
VGHELGYMQGYQNAGGQHVQGEADWCRVPSAKHVPKIRRRKEAERRSGRSLGFLRIRYYGISGSHM